MADIETERTASSPEAGGGPGQVEREFTVKARTQRELVTRRFLRHRAALAGMITLGAIILLGFSSIGVGPIPGWWSQSYSASGTVQNSGHMSLDLFPAFVDGDGVKVGRHPFGQDDVGRDYFALTMRGAQRSLVICFLVGLVSTGIGVVVGALAGFFRGATEAVLMRITDLFLTIPLLVTAAVVGRNVGDAGAVALGLVLGAVLWTSLARLTRGDFLSLREKEFVEAARATGASSGRIIFKHILPNAIGTIIVNATLTIAAAIILETTLSFIGFGVRPPDTSLGQMISQYQDSFSTRPWLFWWPGLFIIAIALSVNFIGDGLRDAFDPKQTRVRA